MSNEGKSIKLCEVQTIQGVPWAGSAQTRSLVIRRIGDKVNGTLELDTTARVIVATSHDGKVGLIPMENVAYMKPLTPAIERSLAPPPPAEKPKPPPPAKDDTVKFVKDGKGRVVEVLG